MLAEAKKAPSLHSGSSGLFYFCALGFQPQRMAPVSLWARIAAAVASVKTSPWRTKIGFVQLQAVSVTIDGGGSVCRPPVSQPPSSIARRTGSNFIFHMDTLLC